MTTDLTWIWTGDLEVKENSFEKERRTEWCGANIFPREPDELRQHLGHRQKENQDFQLFSWLRDCELARVMQGLPWPCDDKLVQIHSFSLHPLCTEGSQTGRIIWVRQRKGAIYKLSIRMCLPHSKLLWVLAFTAIDSVLWTPRLVILAVHLTCPYLATNLTGETNWLNEIAVSGFDKRDLQNSQSDNCQISLTS